MGIETILSIVVITVGVIIFILGRKKTNESNALSKYVPVDTINSIPFGIPIVANGTVTVDQPLVSPITKKPCVYYEYILEREEEKKDQNGNTSWEWKPVGSSQRQTIPFYLEDKSGKIQIKPEDCEVNDIYHTQQFLQPGTIQKASTGLKLFADAFQFGNQNATIQGNRERVTEYTIFTEAFLSVFGIVTMEGNLKFMQTTKAYPLILSPLSKDQLVGSERKSAYLFYAFALVLIILGIFLSVQK